MKIKFARHDEGPVFQQVCLRCGAVVFDSPTMEQRHREWHERVDGSVVVTVKR